jgi:glycosyltransferase involved in cell wall biosynthesis
MLSILIPEYNHPCDRLVRVLAAQCVSLDIDFEILVMDDASTDFYFALNRTIEDLPNVRLLQAETNLGPARIRNRLAEKAAYPNLLFIDCDTEVPSFYFVKHYVEAIGKADLVLGGVAYDFLPPSSDRYLRWYYGRKRESLLAEERSKHIPRVSYNFMIRKEIIMQYPFNENIVDYGHEDIVLGEVLQKAGVTILHIDNPLIHLGLDSNLAFLEKSRRAVEKMVLNPVFQEKEAAGQIKIFRYFNWIKQRHLCSLLSLTYRVAGKWMEKNLCSEYPSLFIYDFYRLTYLCFLFKHPAK